jgi:RNase H-fold protein (predicted Holliday junction resolvase)
MILAIDPGKDKCGLAVLDPQGRVATKAVLARADLVEQLPEYLRKFTIPTLVIGQGHFGQELARELEQLKLSAHLVFVSEKFSTLEARKLYWQENKPRGLLRLVPTSLRLPPVPIDDHAAVILGQRYLKV